MTKPITMIFTIVGIGLFLLGCSNGVMEQTPHLEGSKPTKVVLNIGDKTYDTILGSYCWPTAEDSQTCIDTPGPMDLLEDKDSVVVKKGEMIEIDMDYKPLPNEVHVLQMMEKEGEEKSVEFNN